MLAAVSAALLAGLVASPSPILSAAKGVAAEVLVVAPVVYMVLEAQAEPAEQVAVNAAGEPVVASRPSLLIPGFRGNRSDLCS